MLSVKWCCVGTNFLENVSIVFRRGLFLNEAFDLADMLMFNLNIVLMRI